MSLPRTHLFDLPEGIVYLDGNSLGPLPRSVPGRVSQTVTGEWGAHLITAWNRDGWMEAPTRVADRLARLIGAPPGSTVLGDTLSVKVYQALAAALDLNPDRRVILSDTGNFPTDLYMAEGLIRQTGKGHVLKTVPPDEVADAIDESVAAVMLTHVDYGTGRMHDMGAITQKANAAGAVMIWDLAHSAGAVPVDLATHAPEFAVGCTYKFLNAGPGAPAFIHARADIAERATPALSGWLGHDAPFAFELSYRPAPGIERLRVGTPPILQIAALDAALDVWEGLEMAEVRDASIRLSELFIAEVERTCPALDLASPRDPAKRGSQVSFRHPEGYAFMQALIARGVIGDFRAPDILRFGITPLYLGEDDIRRAAGILADIMANDLWDTPEYRRRQRVT